MTKITVTHIHPDLDAVMSQWLWRRFEPGWEEAEQAFVPAGQTYRNMPVDSDPLVIHTDTGMGKYDHHQPGRPDTSASALVYQDLVERGQIQPTDSSLKAMVAMATEIDNFLDLFWPEPEHSRYAFMLHEIIPALHKSGLYDDLAVLKLAMVYLDAVYLRLQNQVRAERDIAQGEEIVSRYGRTLVIESQADDVSKVAQRMGYDLTIILDPHTKYIKIKLSPKVELKLEPIYAKICEQDDPQAWVYHASGRMLFTGTNKGPSRVPSKLSFAQVVDLIKQFK